MDLWAVASYASWISGGKKRSMNQYCTGRMMMELRALVVGLDLSSEFVAGGILNVSVHEVSLEWCRFFCTWNCIRWGV